MFIKHVINNPLRIKGECVGMSVHHSFCATQRLGKKFRAATKNC
jgi:hypothetical protein